ncbi:zf-HC2 domain-containing protein [Streptomyces bobili]|uniref:zf-HC2 domain-containing protein n=1 Tax=Streptomyces bobili TaxID=67280 RepID=UPI00224DED47|nr:zf-HC2 domain-containing protein [Streptomyces bobili]MCX5524111.1 zf-HC2 domain-containing protein [Streptomyces bobili]
MTHARWHATDTLAARYADGTLPESDAWSLEKHLEHCTSCATRVSHAVRAGTAGAVLGEVREAVLREALGPRPVAVDRSLPTPVRETPAPTAPFPRARLWSSRVSGRFTLAGAPGAGRPGRFPRLARVLWAAGPAVRGAWSLAVLVVALGAVTLGYGAGVAGARPLLLALAPVVPVLGVALSYGPHADPVHEIAAASPSGGLRLLLTRTVAVLLVSLPLLTLAGLLLPGSGAPGAAAWLLPGLALTLASLALAGYVGSRAGAAVTCGGWLCAVLAPALTSPSAAPSARLAEQLSAVLDGPLAQGAWAASAVLCAAALAARRAVYDRLP